MFACLSSRVHAAPHLRWITGALAAVISCLLAWALTVPAASAATIPVPGPAGGYGLGAATSPVQAAVAGGMPGWQIILIAVAAALAAATSAVFLDRARTSRRAVTG